MVENKIAHKKYKWINQNTDDLFRTILLIESIDEARKFFRDLLTEKEILEFTNRWKTAKLLDEKIPYLQIEKETGLSSTTIARIHKWLKKGMGGYQLMLKRLKIIKNSDYILSEIPTLKHENKK